MRMKVPLPDSSARRSYLLRETKYDKGTIKMRADMIWSRSIFMLGNNAIHELTTDQIVEIIIRTYAAYDSKGISSVIRVFTDDLYDYQEAIFPEMTWEKLLSAISTKACLRLIYRV
jgi:hypothetical protein